MTLIEELPILGSEPPLVGRLNRMTRELQARSPVCRVRTQTGDEAWLVTRHAELKQLLLDDRLGRTHPDPANRSRYLNNEMLELLATGVDPAVDRETHVQVRAALTPLFSAKRMSILRHRVAARVHEGLNAIIAEGPPTDMHATFSLPVSFRVLGDLLGISELHEFWTLLNRAGEVANSPEAQDGRPPIFHYLAELAARKRVCPDDGVISSLCASVPENIVVAGLTANDIVANLIASLAFSYQVTPANISAGIALLAAHPDQRDLLIHDRTLLPSAVEETVRMGKVGEDVIPRYASEDIEIGGVTIRAGDLVLCDHLPASFDDRVFDQPERFDITRSPNPHLGFSHGMWHCIGAALARLEIQEFLDALVSRLPTLRLTVPLDQIPLASDEQLGTGIAELPVTW